MGTVLSFIRYCVSVVISLVSAALEILLLPVDRKRGRVFHAIARTWAHAVLAVCGIRVKVRGIKHIDPGRNYVYVSNHASMFDIPAIIAGVHDQIRIIYKKELEIIPVFGWGLKWGSYIAIDRGRSTRAMRSLEEAVTKIRNGASVLLYAEGTRTTDGTLQPFKRGAFNLAVRAGVPVVPLTINGSYSLLPKHSMRIRPGTVEIVLGRPIPVEGEGKDAEIELMEKVHAAIARHYINQ
jgi:1-acyl-sn-glycerol-3-phosphate acyltransferase